ncbi:hypothetical protein [Tahibacter harae]|uniref:Carbohydrate binding protein with CBM11 domain n=1 Tax=Tahibacter harae TaxID=2963937 RepID=A0ABT1QRT9_9GAMM|nr:hypothetical protein [Tahibacter harae]MCQ4164999.1 hypothetical protein [Tahibacter harae]
MLHRIVLLAGLLASLPCAAARETTKEAAKAPARDVAFVNPGFEEAPQGKSIPGWRKSMHAGENVFEFDVVNDVAARGKRSFRLRRKGEQVYGALDQTIPAGPLLAKAVEVTLQVRSKDLGAKGFYPFLNLTLRNGGLAGEQVRGETVTGTLDKWKTIKMKIDVPYGVQGLQLGLLLDDEGTVWVDDITVRIVGEARNPGKKDGPKLFMIH